MKKSHIH